MTNNWELPSPFIFKTVVNAHDIDGFGHANNASYVTWCENCAWRHSESLGLSIQDYQHLDRGMAIQHANYHYLLPGYENETLLIATWLVNNDRKLKLKRRFQIVNADSGATVLRGDWELVCVTLSTGKPTRMPDIFKSVYAGAVVPGSQTQV